MTDSPIKCKIPKIIYPSPIKIFVASVMINPSEKIKSPRLRNFKNAGFSLRDKTFERLNESETPQINRKIINAALPIIITGIFPEAPGTMPK